MHAHPPASPEHPLSYSLDAFITRPWPVVDWFVPADLREDAPDTLRRMRLLVVSVGVVVPFLFFGAFQLLIAGDLLSGQGLLMAGAGALLLACPVILRFTGSPSLPSALFCLSFIALQFFLAATDAGIEDTSLYWTVLLPLVAAFMAGPWLSLLCAGVILAGLAGLYALEVSDYVFPHISTPAEVEWFTMLSLMSATIFAAVLGWIYEGFTLRRLRRMNARLQGLQGALEESEARYRGLFNNMPVGIYRSSPEGRVLMANRALIEMLGFQGWEEFAEFDLERVYDEPGGRRRFREQMARDGQVGQFESALWRADGGRVFVRENARATFDAEGNVLYYEGTVEDVTAHRQAQQALRASEERFRALVQHSTDTITVLDAEGSIVYQSPSVQQNLGYDPEMLIGTKMLDIVHPDDQRRVRVLFRRGLRQPGDFGTVEFRCRHAEGHYIYVEATGSNMTDNPAIGGVVLNARDVTERKRAEVALIQAKEQAEEVARMKGAFLANMSHEIRTPLTGILGFAGVLAEEVDADHREFVDLIEKSGRRLLDTLNSVLDLARLEADQMELELRVLDVAEHTREAVRLLRPLAQERGLTLAVEGPETGVYAKLDPSCLSRILNNLVGNAIKFTESGGVSVRVAAKHGAVRLEVVDTGVGIDAAFVPHLFEEFKQESTGIGRSHEGSGLGLTITKKLVEIQHGHIAVSSAKGRGSTFTITFSQADPPEPGVEVLGAEEVMPVRPRVLVLDDNESARLLLSRMLRPLCTVDTAATSVETLRLATETRYDLILLDIHLSEEASGVEVMRQLRRLPAYAYIPIIAFTAFALPGDRERFINAGFSGYLGKPFTKEQLFRLVKEGLEAREAIAGDGSSRSAGLPRPDVPDEVGDPLASATFLSS